MKYWLCVTNLDNWKIIKHKKIWGVSERNAGLINRTNKGDVLIFYVKPKKIAGIFQVVSQVFKEEKEVFKTKRASSEETFPYRILLAPIIITKTPLNFKDVVPDLSFVISKTFWTGYVRRAMREIPKEDYEIIKSRLEMKTPENL